MTTTSKTMVNKDLANKKITVEREFAAPVEQVWKAWTDSKLLDKWWAPKPWRAETKSMDFRPGGLWLYCMVGPDNEKIWARVDFQSVDALKSYTGTDAFCDEHGNKSSDMPNMSWRNEFHGTADGTRVVVNISFSSEADIKTTIEMGFEAGFTSAMDNLDELLAG